MKTLTWKTTSFSQVWNELKIFLAGFMALAGIVIGSVFTYQTVIKPVMNSVSISSVKADGNDDSTQSYSFYDMTAMLSGYYNAASSPSGYTVLNTDTPGVGKRSLLTDAAVNGAIAGGKGEEGWGIAHETWVAKSKNIAGGGSLLGFPDKKVVDGGIFGFLASQTSASTMDYSYASLATRKMNETEFYNSLETYAYYGASLNALGIDSSIGGVMSIHPIRMAGGGLVWLAYIVSSFTDFFFKFVIEILKFTNPFQFFSQISSHRGWMSNIPLFNGVVTVVSGTYNTLLNFGWLVMVPIIVSMFIFAVIFSGNGRQSPELDRQRRNRFRYGLIYMLFLAVGVPFLGTAYTAGLNGMSESLNGKSIGVNSFSADSIILSTYIDNQKWIENSRMYLPESAVVKWDIDAQDATSDAKASIRSTALKINALNYGAAESASKATDDSSLNWNTATSNQASDTVNISALLLDYMTGKVYNPSTWETTVKSYLTSEAADNQALSRQLTLDSLQLSTDYKYLGNLTGALTSQVKKESSRFVAKNGIWDTLKGTQPIQFGDHANMFIYKGFDDNHGRGGVVAQKNGSIVDLRSNSGVTTNPGLNYNSGAVFSYLEMYNYLNSVFTENQIRVYSTGNLSSNFVRESHAAVNQVGAGMMHKFLIWLNTFMLLLGAAIIAFFYALGILVGAFRRYFKIIGSIFTGTAGLIGGMVLAAAGTFMLIIETLGGIVIYQVVINIYTLVPNIIESGFSAVATSVTPIANLGFASGSGVVGFVGVIVGLIISPVILGWMMWMILKVRTPLMDVIDSAITNLVNKLFYGEGNIPSEAPKMSGPARDGKSGMNNALSAAGGAIAGALGSNIDGADDNVPYDVGADGENGEATSSDGSSGDDGSNGSSASSDNDGPDAVVASNRDTEETGEGVRENGQLNRDSGGVEQSDGQSSEGMGDASHDQVSGQKGESDDSNDVAVSSGSGREQGRGKQADVAAATSNQTGSTKANQEQDGSSESAGADVSETGDQTGQEASSQEAPMFGPKVEPMMMQSKKDGVGSSEKGQSTSSSGSNQGQDVGATSDSNVISMADAAAKYGLSQKNQSRNQQSDKTGNGSVSSGESAKALSPKSTQQDSGKRISRNRSQASQHAGSLGKNGAVGVGESAQSNSGSKANQQVGTNGSQQGASNSRQQVGASGSQRGASSSKQQVGASGSQQGASSSKQQVGASGSQRGASSSKQQVGASGSQRGASSSKQQVGASGSQQSVGSRMAQFGQNVAANAQRAVNSPAGQFVKAGVQATTGLQLSQQQGNSHGQGGNSSVKTNSATGNRQSGGFREGVAKSMSEMKQAGSHAVTGVRQTRSGVTNMAKSVSNVANGVSQSVKGNGAEGLRQMQSGLKDGVRGAKDLGSGVKSAMGVAKNVGSTYVRASTGTAKLLSPIGNKLSKELSDTVKQSVAASFGSGQRVANDYYYDDERVNHSRPTSQSQDRNDRQTNRSDARIRRTSRPR